MLLNFCPNEISLSRIFGFAAALVIMALILDRHLIKRSIQIKSVLSKLGHFESKMYTHDSLRLK